MTRLELANQLIENQPAFHFAFIPKDWYRRRDLNPHCLVSKTSASCQLGYAGMVDLARFERATLTFAESRSDSTELQVQRSCCAQPHMQNQIHLCYKTDEGRERHSHEHTSRHTSPEDGELADSRKAPSSSSERRLPAFISQKGISIVKKLKERA